ncbi:MAG: hypothetical protein JSW43_11280 [Gemmatimonadota bacterium]|nr:MAG: hypothetical protein JSW43_11280 [Gemmatimonadota bacterium]
MLQTLLRLGIVGAMLLGLAANADAQASRRQGFYFSMGLGGGADLSVSDNTTGGFAGYLRAAGTPSPRFVVGGEVKWLVREELTSVWLTRGTGTANVLFYPSPVLDLFVNGGLGLSWVALYSTGGGTVTDEWDTGFGTTIGVGYDIRISDTFSITPNLDFLYQLVSDTNGYVLMLTVGAAFH